MFRAVISESSDTTTTASGLSCVKPILSYFLVIYLLSFVIFTFSARAQGYLVYLHWVRPPPFLYPLSNLRPYRLAGYARVIHQHNLGGWHLLPPGPPFYDGNSEHFDTLLARPNQRVILFFHGNCGTRAFPSKRVDLIRLLSSQLRAHVITFDYSGFGDSAGRPSAHQLHEDAKQALKWISKRISPDTDIIVYGQSLGTFAAVDLCACIAESPQIAGSGNVKGVILDAPPASLVDAAMTHPVTRIFRVLPFMRRFFSFVARDPLDSKNKIGRISAPLLIMHGELDNMVDIGQGQELHRCALRGGNGDVQFVSVEGAGHTDVNAAPEFLRVVHRFLQRSLSSRCQLVPDSE
eukprot:GFKZ01009401.1.p1 GENE.GFKZ01009401.1~~GFKZ01009401.1.p1  ORF type:complete len:350 (-),score=20.72 GFKZ01009401.1:666-1715(-)